MSKYIDVDKLIAEIDRRKMMLDRYEDSFEEAACCKQELVWMKDFIDSLQEEAPDKETILRICKLHKAWSIMAPWENVEDFVRTNWNSENIV